jgi:hypothetical protein
LYNNKIIRHSTPGEHSMPATVSRDQGKTAFIKQVLFDDELANTAKVNELWAKSGHDGTVSVSLVNKMRSEMGLTGNLRRGPKSPTKKAYTGKKRGRKPKSEQVEAAPAIENGTAAGSSPTFRGRNARLNRLVDVETDIDRLLFKVMAVDGLTDVEDALRQARRVLYRVIG